MIHFTQGSKIYLLPLFHLSDTNKVGDPKSALFFVTGDHLEGKKIL